ncbi:hypothetical protein O9929_25235 [Vibrio lentus]|nr:hypothetical protein [Vibrio lentus]
MVKTPFVTFGFGPVKSQFKTYPAIYLEESHCRFGQEPQTAYSLNWSFAIKDNGNHQKQDPNYDIKQLALECAFKRMYLDILNYDKAVEDRVIQKRLWVASFEYLRRKW